MPRMSTSSFRSGPSWAGAPHRLPGDAWPRVRLAPGGDPFLPGRGWGRGRCMPAHRHKHPGLSQPSLRGRCTRQKNPAQRGAGHTAPPCRPPSAALPSPGRPPPGPHPSWGTWEAPQDGPLAARGAGLQHGDRAERGAEGPGGSAPPPCPPALLPDLPSPGGRGVR